MNTEFELVGSAPPSEDKYRYYACTLIAHGDFLCTQGRSEYVGMSGLSGLPTRLIAIPTYYPKCADWFLLKKSLVPRVSILPS
jgi:hypothetical protein